MISSLRNRIKPCDLIKIPMHFDEAHSQLIYDSYVIISNTDCSWTLDENTLQGLAKLFFQFTSFSILDFLFQSISRVSPFTYVFPHDSTFNGRPLLGLHFHPAVEVPNFVYCNLRLQHNIFKQTMAVNWRNFSCVLHFLIPKILGWV